MISERQKSTLRWVLGAIVVALVIGFASESALAQCVMCRASIGSNSLFAKRLSIGTVVLLVPPVSIFCTIFVLAFRHRKSA